jgi:hypothetical protein
MQRPVCYRGPIKYNHHGALLKYASLALVLVEVMLLYHFLQPPACRENWKSVGSIPLVCEMCPPRSERPTSQNVTGCICTVGYEMKSSMCLGKYVLASFPGSPSPFLSFFIFHAREYYMRKKCNIHARELKERRSLGMRLRTCMCMLCAHHTLTLK